MALSIPTDVLEVQYSRKTRAQALVPFKPDSACDEVGRRRKHEDPSEAGRRLRMEQTFDHNGITFRVIKQAPAPTEIVPGDWVRISYDPNAGKPDKVGKVISCRRFWPLRGQEFANEDYRVDLLLNADPEDDYWFSHSEEYCELVAPINLQSQYRSRGTRNIAVFFDGTSNQNETQNTNVHRLYGVVDKRSTIGNYYSGVGVGGRRIGNVLDMAGGRGLFRIVRSAYTFVRGNYLHGDKIFIFGFSRGAYAARHLAGMIARIGIHHNPEVGWENYRESLMSGHQPQQVGGDRVVHFLGMFDCVAGNKVYTFGRKHRINNSILEPDILCMTHAVSRDERRWSFQPLIFESTKQRRFSQAWFPGYHFDVGGDKNPPLNNFALAWMLVAASESGLTFSNLEEYNFDANAPGQCSDWPQTRLRGCLLPQSHAECRPDLTPARPLRLAWPTRSVAQRTTRINSLSGPVSTFCPGRKVDLSYAVEDDHCASNGQPRSNSQS